MRAEDTEVEYESASGTRPGGDSACVSGEVSGAGAGSSTERRGLRIFTPLWQWWHFDKGLSTLDRLLHELANGNALAPMYA